MKPYVGQGAYINYPDPILAATSSWPQAYYGGNLDAYVAVKTKYVHPKTVSLICLIRASRIFVPSQAMMLLFLLHL